jgi:hypothetical protein
MNKHQALLFKRLSSETEEILTEHLLTLKGGGVGESDGIPLEEVEIISDPPAEGPSDPEPIFDEPWSPGNDDPGDDGWNNEGGGYDPPGDEPECTCELGTNGETNSNEGIKDPNGIFGSLKSFLSEQTSNLIALTPSQVAQFGGGVQRQLIAFAKATSLVHRIEDSGKTIRIEVADLKQAGSGLTSKDISNGDYVIEIHPGNNIFGNNTLLMHELVHFNQILDGELGFDSQGNVTLLGIEDEIEAYQMAYDLESGAGLPPIQATAEHIYKEYPGVYDKLPASGVKCALHG